MYFLYLQNVVQLSKYIICNLVLLVIYRKDSEYIGKIQRIFVFLLLLSFLSVCCVIMLFGPMPNHEAGDFITLLPAEVSTPDENTRIFSFVLEDVPQDKSYIAFLSVHENVTVKCAGRTYPNLEEQSIFGHTTGTVYNFILVPDSTRRILIKCENVYPGISQKDFVFYYGDGLHIQKYLLRNSLLSCIISLVDICLGFAMIFYWLMARTRIDHSKSLLNLGLFTVLMGFWTFNETNISILFILDGIPSTFLSFTLLMIVVIPYTLFISKFLEIKNKKKSTLIISLAMINYVLCCILQIANIADFKQTAFLSHLILACGILYQLYALYDNYVHHGMNFKLKMNCIGSFFLAAVVIIDLISYYRGIFLINELGRFSLLIYTFTLGLASIMETNQIVDENRKMEVYKELAFTDTLTGCLNRNAYNDFLTNVTPQKGNLILSFDLNELKECNDTQGHQSGDQYLKDAAGIIKDVFSHIGKCYRIGGDEFCVFIEDETCCDIDHILYDMQMKQAAYRRKYISNKMEIAIGYASYDPCKDRTLEDTRNRSDELMYQMKINMKSS